MRARVVDASALAALIHAEPEAPEIAERLADATLIARALIAHELDSVCVKKIRANPRDRLRSLEARALAGELGIILLEVDHGGVIELALETWLTAYDAAYLWLAAAHGARPGHARRAPRPRLGAGEALNRGIRRNGPRAFRAEPLPGCDTFRRVPHHPLVAGHCATCRSGTC